MNTFLNRLAILAVFLFVLMISFLVSSASAATVFKPGKYLAIPNKTIIKKQIKASQKKKMRAKSFAKAGDSNTEMSFSFYSLGCQPFKVNSRYRHLQKTIDYYQSARYPSSWKISRADCLNSNPFTRFSAASRSGTFTDWQLTNNKRTYTPGAGFIENFGWADSKCLKNEKPFDCEIRLMKPRFTIIMSGTNDFGWSQILEYSLSPQAYTQRIDRLIRRARWHGTVPVLSTMPITNVETAIGSLKLTTWVQRSNQALLKYAKRQNVPIIDFYSALKDQTKDYNNGLVADGLHLSSPSETDRLTGTNWFAQNKLVYGANVRNLLTLEMLYRLNK